MNGHTAGWDIDPDHTDGSNTWSVNKFGGTSVANAEAMARVKDILVGEMQNCQHNARMAVVVSAMGGKPKVTDMLLKTVSCAAAQDVKGYTSILQEIYDKHATALAGLGLLETDGANIIQAIQQDLSDLKDLLRAVALMRYENEKMQELVSGYGETWSSQILCAVLNAAGYDFAYLNARRVLIVDEEAETGPEIMWARSEALLQEFLSSPEAAGKSLVITGFIATTATGVATTLKRDGSDYSASIFGRLLHAGAVNIWTDVDGVMSADPRRVPEAKVLAEVSFNEAMELAYFGAKVIHPKTMQPAVIANIPVFIKNTFAPALPGTRIFKTSTATKDRARCVCGFSTVDDIALLNIEGSGMVGVPGVAKRLFGALQQMGISVILISQASSEHSISVAIKSDRAEQARKGVSEAFATELRHGHITNVDVLDNCCIVAAVGDGMSHTTGVAGRFFSSLGTAGINILAIAQGCSEKNISCVVRAAESTRALRTVHSAFLLSHQTISVGVVGAGRIGAAFLDMLQQQHPQLLARFNVDFKVRAIAGADKMVLADSHVDLSCWRQSLAAGEPLDTAHLVTHLRPDHLPHGVIMDFTSTTENALRHVEWLGCGLHMVSNNPLAIGGDLAYYHRLLGQRGLSELSYQYETTVGGGLPIIATLQSLLTAGDTVERVEGVVSGCLSYIFNRTSPAPVAGEGAAAQTVTFSQACREAVDLGLMDPQNPAGQLSCERVRRRVLILGRELGLELLPEDVATEQLLPAGHSSSDGNSGSADDLMTSLGAMDGPWAERVAGARSRGSVLRYVCTVDAKGGSAHAGVQEVPFQHEYARLQGAAYCVRYMTQRMEGAPLVLQGPMGGDKTIASAIFADLLRVARDLGARDRGPRHLMRSFSRIDRHANP